MCSGTYGTYPWSDLIRTSDVIATRWYSARDSQVLDPRNPCPKPLLREKWRIPEPGRSNWVSNEQLRTSNIRQSWGRKKGCLMIGGGQWTSPGLGCLNDPLHRALWATMADAEVGGFALPSKLSLP